MGMKWAKEEGVLTFLTDVKQMGEGGGGVLTFLIDVETI